MLDLTAALLRTASCHRPVAAAKARWWQDIPSPLTRTRGAKAAVIGDRTPGEEQIAGLADLC